MLERMPLRVLHVNSHDLGGGAERVAGTLADGLRRRGHKVCMAVGFKRGTDPHVVELTDAADGVWDRVRRHLDASLAPFAGRIPGPGRARVWLRRVGRRQRLLDWWRGRETFEWPASRTYLSDVASRFDVVHLHNLHSDYFDLELLPRLSRSVPVIATLHDEWMLTGHCACTLGCERWRVGCGQCPDLSIYPAIRRDATADNWERKRKIFAASRLVIVTPSHWLGTRVSASALAPAAIRTAVVPNGIDLRRFCPGDRALARHKLALPAEADVVVFTASGGEANRFKDHQTLRTAMAMVSVKRFGNRPLCLVLFGSQGEPRTINGYTEHPIRLPAGSDLIPEIYRAADVYVHASNADNFPLGVLEALACGIPVVATAVGGIPDQFPAITALPLAASTQATQGAPAGLLVPPRDAPSMADAILRILAERRFARELGATAHDVAVANYDAEAMVTQYERLYEDALGAHRTPT